MTGAVISALLAACTSSHARVPEGASAEESVAFDADASRPLLADVNGDGVVDLVARNRARDGYVAISGNDGKELWRTQPTKNNDPYAFAWVAGKRLLSVGSGGLKVFDLANGKFLRSVELDSAGQLPCEATPGNARMLLTDGTVAAVDVESGGVEHEHAGSSCIELRTDRQEAKDQLPEKAQVTRVGEGGVPTLRCTDGSSSPPESGRPDDPCAQIGTLSGSDSKAEIVPDVVLTTEFGALVLGRKKTGPPLPALALIKDRKQVWAAFPTVEKPSTLDRVAIDHGEVAILYDDTTGLRLLSWDIATGRQRLDIVLSRRAKWIDGDGKNWIVTGSSVAFRVETSGGTLRPIAGGLASAEPEWNAGWPVPRGYVTETHATPDGKEMAIGGSLFAGMMIANVIIYAHLDDPKRLWPLLVPAVGPFINIGTIVPNFADVTGLLFDGATQAVGIVLFSVGAAQKTTTLKPAVRPSVGLGTFGIQGSF
jgi:hypothetical protein